MDIQQLRYFKRVVDDGSLSKGGGQFLHDASRPCANEINNLENEIRRRDPHPQPPRVFSLAMRGERFTTMPSVSSP